MYGFIECKSRLQGLWCRVQEVEFRNIQSPGSGGLEFKSRVLGFEVWSLRVDLGFRV